MPITIYDRKGDDMKTVGKTFREKHTKPVPRTPAPVPSPAAEKAAEGKDKNGKGKDVK